MVVSPQWLARLMSPDFFLPQEEPDYQERELTSRVAILPSADMSISCRGMVIGQAVI